MHKSSMLVILGCMFGISFAYAHQRNFQTHSYMTFAPTRAGERCAKLADSYTSLSDFRESGVADHAEQVAIWQRIFDQCSSEDL